MGLYAIGEKEKHFHHGLTTGGLFPRRLQMIILRCLVLVFMFGYFSALACLLVI
jgi:hypothetical protein